MTENKENKTENKKPTTPLIPKKPSFVGNKVFKPISQNTKSYQIRKPKSGKA